MEFPPLRNFHEFIGNSQSYTVVENEELRDRIVRNLLNYQTNYCLALLLTLCIIGYVN